MKIVFLNPQGNFDPNDSYWTEHPDFGGQLVYVKETALAMAALGHQVDIVTRQIIDPQWPEFAAALDTYPAADNVRIVRIPCGPPTFLTKEELWPHLGTDWVSGIRAFYAHDGGLPDFVTAHYADGGLAAAILRQQTGVPFTFTGHSLGAQKMDKLHALPDNLAGLDARYRFSRRILAERVSMNHAARIVVSTRQEQMEQYSHPAYRGAVDVHETDGPRFAVIPPGVNRRVFSDRPDPLDRDIEARIQAALARDLSPDRLHLPLVICSSRLDPKKNHLGLVQAFAQSEALRRTANLAIVVRGLDDPLAQRGQLSGPERQILDEIVHQMDAHGLRGLVTAFPLNSQAELAAAYRVAAASGSVFALTALYEPFGLAPLEAMSCGLPAVVTRNGGPAESLFDAAGGTEYGVLVDPADPADIARGLLKVLASPASWQYYHRAGLERVISRYTWSRTAEGYLSVIEQVLAEPESAPATLPIPAWFTNPVPENSISLA
ncbi:MAG: glycosyltransferase family 1 protein, partial [Chloroflexi bacterium]